MEYNFDNERPIYIQLVEMLKIEIISGRIKSGEKLPSVRDFAMKAKVNPNTMQKALTELERENLIYTERTNGKYVTNDRKLIDNIKNEIIDPNKVILVYCKTGKRSKIVKQILIQNGYKNVYTFSAKV